MFDSISRDAVEQKLKDAIKLFEDQDKYLLTEDINERSITHKLAEYLKQQFQGWDVDCEYNRNVGQVKKLENLEKEIKKNQSAESLARDTQGRTVFPDIIVHKRGRGHEDKGNLLVIEVKKSSSSVSEEHDLKKLQGYKEELGYQYAVFLKAEVGKDSKFNVPKFI